MSRHVHVMYASPSHIKQIFSERYGDVRQIEIGETEEISSSVGGKLGSLIAQLRGNFSNKVGYDEIHTINFDDDVAQIKRVVNDLLADDRIPDVGELFEADGNPTKMYRFSSEVILKRETSELDGKTIIEVVGFEDHVKFHGKTSVENWGSISDILTALDAMDTYPVQGILTPVSKVAGNPEYEEWVVNYLFMCTPTVKDRKNWYNRQILVDELYQEKTLE